MNEIRAPHHSEGGKLAAQLMEISVADFTLRDARAGDEPAIRQVVWQVLEEFGFATDPSGLDSDLVDVTASYLQRGGSFRVLTTPSGQIVGCGGLYPMDAGVAELRKIFFLPIARGRGFGRQLIGELVTFGRDAGFQQIVLETASKLHVAAHIYRTMGFVETTSERLASRCDRALALQLHEAVHSALT